MLLNKNIVSFTQFSYVHSLFEVLTLTHHQILSLFGIRQYLRITNIEFFSRLYEDAKSQLAIGLRS